MGDDEKGTERANSGKEKSLQLGEEPRYETLPEAIKKYRGAAKTQTQRNPKNKIQKSPKRKNYKTPKKQHQQQKPRTPKKNIK